MIRLPSQVRRTSTAGPQATGDYDSTKECAANADIGTNATAANKISVTGGTAMVCGDASAGEGGNPVSVITGGGTITGGRGALEATIPLADVTVPTLENASPYAPGSGTLAPNKRSGYVSCSGGPGTTLKLSAGSYVFDSLSISGTMHDLCHRWSDFRVLRE